MSMNVFRNKKKIDIWDRIGRDIDSMDGGESIVCWQFEVIGNEDVIEKIEKFSTQLIP